MTPVVLARTLVVLARTLAALACLVLGPGLVSPAAGQTATETPGTTDAPAGSETLEVRVLGQGKPVQNILVFVHKDDGSSINMPNQPASTPLRKGTSDSTGFMKFEGLAPGRYVLSMVCERIPENWIGANSSTKVEILAGRPGFATLTVRRGGMVRGRVTQAGNPVPNIRITTETGNALPSECSSLRLQGPDSSGAFIVRKVPLDSRSWIKTYLPLGSGELAVWRDFNLEVPETLNTEWTLPSFKDAELGSALIGVRLPNRKYVEKGHAELVLVRQGPKGYRYEVTATLSETDTLKKLVKLPPGRYNFRAFADPGTKVWWTADPDTIVIQAGRTTRKVLTGRPRDLPGTGTGAAH